MFKVKDIDPKKLVEEIFAYQKCESAIEELISVNGVVSIPATQDDRKSPTGYGTWNRFWAEK